MLSFSLIGETFYVDLLTGQELDNSPDPEDQNPEKLQYSLFGFLRSAKDDVINPNKTIKQDQPQNSDYEFNDPEIAFANGNF